LAVNESAILQYDGISWREINIGGVGSPISFWGASADDIFAVGSGGLILHYTESKTGRN
jgi:hypothetical protein